MLPEERAARHRDPHPTAYPASLTPGALKRELLRKLSGEKLGAKASKGDLIKDFPVMAPLQVATQGPGREQVKARTEYVQPVSEVKLVNEGVSVTSRILSPELC